jgi:glycerophosphoryl diester phosphodiesterase
MEKILNRIGLDGLRLFRIATWHCCWVTLLGLGSCTHNSGGGGTKLTDVKPDTAQKPLSVTEPADEETLLPLPENFDFQGHRGARGLLPENSIVGFNEALEYEGLTTLELDVVVTMDHQVIVSHEPWFNPVICRERTGAELTPTDVARRPIYKMTYSEIQKYDCGGKGHPDFPRQKKRVTAKPLLEHVFNVTKQKILPGATRNPPRYNIEAKCKPEWDDSLTPPPNVFAEILAEEIFKAGVQGQVTVQSFDPRFLKEFRKIAPKIPISLLVEDDKSLSEHLSTLNFVPEIYSPDYRLVTPELVQECHKKGIKIIPWTVNSVREANKLIRMGVDGIISDYPDMLQRRGPQPPA